MYKENELVRVAKRQNNNKRKYLVVNRLQGKHIPVNGQEAFAMFDELAEIVKKSYSGEKLLLAGFAETATAIGARMAVKLNSSYIQTTRENIPNVEYLYFTESHSHATEQKLIKDDIERVIDSIDRIVFVEDEVTTGNTIMKIIDILEKSYPGKVKFAVASLLNGMDAESLENYDSRNIDVHYLVKTNHSTYTAIADSYKGDGEYTDKNTGTPGVAFEEYTVGNYQNARRCVNGESYENACGVLWDYISSKLDDNDKNLLVVGTEEFMYPALYISAKLSESGRAARCHSTTRSPITVSSEDGYPLHCRFELASLYDDDRTTFIYDLKKYDCVLIVTDSQNESDIGVNTLVNALALCGNDKIKLFRWC